MFELWTYHEALRRIGFKADDIYLGYPILAPDGCETIGVVLRAQGLEFALHGRPHDNPNEFFSKWRTFVESLAKRDRNDPELTETWEKSWVRLNAVELIAKLQAKGFSIGRALNSKRGS
jgi:hypothetical protein